MITTAGGRAWMMAIIDHMTKYWFSWSLGETATTEAALDAWRAAVKTLAGFRSPVDGVIVHHDRDPVFTSFAWVMRLLLQDRARISYALRRAKDNPEMESFSSRFKNENRSLITLTGGS